MAVLLDFSATVHGYVPKGVPSPSKLLRALSTLVSDVPSDASERIPPALESLAKTLEISPMHVDQVAQAICEAIENPHIRGVIDTKSMRAILAEAKLKTSPDDIV